MFTLSYIILIVAVNYGFSVVPLVPFMDVMFPPMSLAVGLIFVARDFAQREIGHKVIGAMVIAGIVSYFMADPYVAIASIAAFAISTPLDSVVFLAIIGHLSFTGVVLMTLSKMVGAVVVWRMVK